jgi:hypothetical protein
MKNVVFWGVSGVVLVRTDVSEKCSASIIRVTRIGEVGTTLAVTSRRLQKTAFSLTIGLKPSGVSARPYI